MTVMERPILFSAPMVRALLAGTKTQTRRAMAKQFCHDAEPEEMCATNERGHQTTGHSGRWWDASRGDSDAAARCPYGVPGDRLWVRETWAPVQLVNLSSGRPEERYEYRAGRMVLEQGKAPAVLRTEPFFPVERWRPSIHMPRAASRITLEVTGVRVERLQDISRGDAMEEGCRSRTWRKAMILAGGMPSCGSKSTAPDRSWDANPWVWAIRFRRIATCVT
jgi:hypothetical protein